jgi:PTS system fructose-specific IIA component/PTS system nitrogen regulatory IIA component
MWPFWQELGFPAVDLPPAALASADAAVRFLVEQLARMGHLREKEVSRLTSQILHREEVGSTALGRGIALPHTKSDAVESVLGVVGTAPNGVAWPNPIDDTPIRLVCLLITPAAKPSESLRALEAVSKRLHGGL